MKGWISSSLQDACEMYQPATITTKEMVPDGAYPVYGANGIIGRYDRFNHEGPQLLVTCRGATCGSVNVSRGRAWITGNSMVIRPRTDSIDLRFLEYLFRGGIDLSRAITGAAQPQITRANLNPIKFSYPGDVSEQRRIVAILDEAFEAIGTAKANTERNLQNAREVFASALAQLFPSSGESISLADLSLSISDGDHSPPPKAPSGVPFITISNVDKETREIDFTNTFTVPRDYFLGLKPQRRPQPGDVLYTVTGSFGIPVLVEGHQEFCFQRHIGLIRPRPNVDSRWLAFALLSPDALAQADAGATGTAQRTVSLGTLRALRLPRVPSDTQCRDADRLDALDIEVGRLKRISRAKLAALDELKKSLMHQAFTGQLTAKSADQQLEAVA